MEAGTHKCMVSKSNVYTSVRGSERVYVITAVTALSGAVPGLSLRLVLLLS